MHDVPAALQRELPSTLKGNGNHKRSIVFISHLVERGRGTYKCMSAAKYTQHVVCHMSLLNS